MPSTRRTFCVAAAAALAGCGTDMAPSSSRSAAPTRTDDPTESPSPTREPVGTGANPVDVEVGNGESTSHELSLRVDGAEPVLVETVTLAPDEHAEYDVDFPGPGSYAVTAELDDGRSASYEWELSDPDPDGWLTLGIREGEPLEFRYAMA